MSYLLYYLLILPVVYFILRKLLNRPRTPIINHDTVINKVVLITGSSSGIGKFTALELLNKGATVIYACRDKKKTLEIINALDDHLKKRAIYLQLDLSSFNSVRNFEQQLSHLNLTINIIINNAGFMTDIYEKTKDNIENTFQSNHLSHMYLTALLLKHLSKDNGRIINVSSMVHKFVKNLDLDSLEKDYEFKNDSLHSRGSYNYFYSKLANIYFTISLAKFFEKNKINFKAVALHPGAVQTSFGTFSGITGIVIKFFLHFVQLLFFKDVEMGSQTTLHCCYLDYYSLINGGYYSDCKLDKISSLAGNDSIRKKFMEYSLKLIKMRVPDCPEDLQDIVNC